MLHSLQTLKTIQKEVRVASEDALPLRSLSQLGGIYILEWPGKSGQDKLSSALVSVGNNKNINEYANLVTDGGGIRGYGSLLILRALMEKVGLEERRIDPAIKSSFSPCMYKPTKIGFSTPYIEDVDSFEANVVTETNLSGLFNDSLFLPCHYFDYGAGTSTGG